MSGTDFKTAEDLDPLLTVKQAADHIVTGSSYIYA